MHVKDKVCVVTGAASGIGEAVARVAADIDGARSLSSGAHSRDPLAPTGWLAMTVYLPSALGANGASRPE
jgi:NAD(P)-dependent dehydrogenase (short-subunit alcohol dehydrogenase family)